MVPVRADTVPTLWGIEEDQGLLFSLTDYTTLSGLTIFSPLLFPDGSAIGRDIEAFDIRSDGVAFMALNSDRSGLGNPVLLSFDITTASITGQNVVTVIGQLDDADLVTGLSFDPSGALYALNRKGGDGTVDELWSVDQATGDRASPITPLVGMGEDVGSGEDIEFLPDGRLFVTDDDDDHLYQVHPVTGGILAISDSQQNGGLGVSSVKFEGLAWDPVRTTLVGTDDNTNLFAELTFGDGANLLLGSLSELTDVEGIDFFDEPPDAQFPEPSAGCLLVLGLLSAAGYGYQTSSRRRKPPE